MKDDKNTVYCNKDFGPVFGYDLYVQNNFNFLYSILGTHYDTADYEVSNKYTHLIGD